METEWGRAQDVLQEPPPVRFRFEPETGGAVSSTVPAAAHTCWISQLPCMEPSRGRSGMTKCQRQPGSPQQQTIGMTKQRVEVSEKRLSPEDFSRFQDAKAVEIKNYLAAQAFEILPRHLQPSKGRAIHMRWLLMWKIKDDGAKKPKARCVILGYQDEAYERRATSAPVMTKQTRQLFLQLAANQKWEVAEGDITGAFLQGKEPKETLYCVPTDEICAALKIPSGSVTRLRRAAYGLLQAPLQWYLTIAEFLEEIGLERLVGHVDDF